MTSKTKTKRYKNLLATKPEFFRNIMPVESPIVSFLALGEGWHNYHHVFPWDYKTGEFGYTLNVTTLFIDICAKLGLANGRKYSFELDLKRVCINSSCL